MKTKTPIDYEASFCVIFSVPVTFYILFRDIHDHKSFSKHLSLYWCFRFNCSHCYFIPVSLIVYFSCWFVRFCVCVCVKKPVKRASSVYLSNRWKKNSAWQAVKMLQKFLNCGSARGNIQSNSDTSRHACFLITYSHVVVNIYMRLR